MTIKDIAAAAGLSHQAIYKRLKARGVKLESIKIKGTGELTEEGETLLREIFSLKDQQEEAAPPPPAAEKEAPAEVESRTIFRKRTGGILSDSTSNFEHKNATYSRPVCT